jgi:hypothetical protein
MFGISEVLSLAVAGEAEAAEYDPTLLRAIDRFYDWVRDPDGRSLVAPLWATTAVMRRSELDRSGSAGEKCGVRIACPLDPSYPVLQYRVCEGHNRAYSHWKAWAEFVPRSDLLWLSTLEWVHGESLPDSPLAIAPIRALVLEYARAVPLEAPGGGPAMRTRIRDGDAARPFPADVNSVDVSSGGLHIGFYTKENENS